MDRCNGGLDITEILLKNGQRTCPLLFPKVVKTKSSAEGPSTQTKSNIVKLYRRQYQIIDQKVALF